MSLHESRIPAQRPGRPRPARLAPLAAVLFSLLSVAAICVSKGGDVVVVNDTTPVNADLTLAVDAHRVSIKFLPGPPGVVETRGAFGSRSRVIHRVRPGTFTPTSNLLIETTVPEKYAAQVSADLEIRVPDGTRIEVRGADSMVEIEGPISLSGAIRLDRGDAILQDVTGDFTITTGQGAITFNRVSGELHAFTGRGSVDLRGSPDASAVSRIETGGGNIFADLTASAQVIPVLAISGRGAILLNDGSDPISGAEIQVQTDSGPAALALITTNGIIDIRR